MVSSRSRIEFRVLGPLEVEVDGHAASLGGPKQRALLAALLLDAGRVVSIERLVDAVWGEAPPATARHSVEVYVSRLRGELADEAGVMLGTRRPGYILRIDRDQLDLTRFEDLVAEGRAALAERDPERAAARLREGLELWRGPPLADVAFESSERRDADRLDELRLAAMEDRIDADLALGRHSRLVGELEALVAEHPLREQPRAQLMVALYRSGRQADALDAYRQSRDLLREELGLEPGVALQQLERRILLHDPALDLDSHGDRSAGASSETVVCPFKGLAFFEAADADYFFGRELLVADMVSRMADRGLVGLVGASGVGKSSILRAGVLPGLAAGALPGSERWRSVLVRPGDQPCRALNVALGSGGLGAATVRLGKGERIVLAVDQLEEVFTACQDEAERRAFMATLADVALDPERRVIVVVALRADFYGRCAGYAPLARLLSASHVLVGPMNADGLAQVIEEPAARAGLDVEQTLVDTLISDIGDEPGGLPLLSTTLVELWRLRDDHHLRLNAYQRSGGVHGAVARLAEQAFGELDAAEQQVARTVMLRLAGGDADSPVRRRVPLADFDVDLNPQSARVLSVLTGMRLLAISEDGVEVSHEALFREWPRLRGWLEEDRAGRRLHAHLAATAQAWDAAGNDPAELYRGARLSAALDWAGQHSAQLNELERAFLTTSQKLNEREARRAQRQNRRLRALLAGVAALFGIALVAIVVALHQQAKATNEAIQAKSRAWAAESLAQLPVDAERSILLAMAAVRESPTPEAVFALRRALDVSPLRVRLPSVGQQLNPNFWGPTVSYSPDGSRVAEGSQDGSVRILDAADGRLLRRIPIGSPSPIVQYSPDGSVLAVGSQRDVRLVDAITGATRLVAHVPGYGAGLLHWAQNFSFSRNGSVVYFADYTDIVRWDLRTNRVRLLASGDIRGVGGLLGLAFARLSPDARRLVVGGVPGVAVIDSASGRVLAASTKGLPFVWWMDLSRDGRQIAVADSPAWPASVGAGKVILLDARTLRPMRTLGALDGDSYTTVGFSPDGHRLAFGTNEGAAGVYDLRSGNVLVSFPGHTTNIYEVAFSPDGRQVATAAGDGKALIWRAAGNEQSSIATNGFSTAADPLQNANLAFLSDRITATFAPVTGPNTGSQVVQSWPLAGKAEPPLPVAPRSGGFVRLSRNGRVVVSGEVSAIGSIGTLTVRDVATGSVTTRVKLKPPPIPGSRPVLSPDGSRIAYGAWSPLRVLVRRISTGQTLSLPVSGCFWLYYDISADNRRVSSNSGCGQAATWDLRTGHQVGRRLGFVGFNDLGPVRLTPNGRRLAVANSGNLGQVTLVDVASGRTIAVLNGDTKGIQDLAFNPSGTLLATASLDGTARIWDARTGRPLRIVDDPAPLDNVAFSPDGRQVATLDYAGVIRIWDACTDCQDPAALMALAKTRVTRQLTPIEQQTYLR
jgi:DNA-binding SARP family transcriptional activator/WD40 repeat protein